MSNYIIECSGIGAKAFLQGQLTCNVNDLKENQPQLTACCNLQGRVIFIANVIMKDEQRYLLCISESMKNIVTSHLEKYARFSKCAINNGQAQGQPLPSTDKKSTLFHGFPNIYPETSEQIIAQRLNLHLINGAISFKKGCYLGQEIISRLHFKGKLKHHMYLGETSNLITLHYGDKILDDKQETVGMIVDFYVEGDKTFLLFVNAIENKHPRLKDNQEIRILDLPYSFRDEPL